MTIPARKTTRPIQAAVKRLFDVTCAAAGLVVLAPVFAVVCVLIRVGSPGPIFFRQRRMGRDFQPFDIYKFRTMVVDAPKLGAAITAGRDPRITGIGWHLRKYKLDELPQLINVLRGEMSLVGPRPEVPKYVEMFREDYARVLAVRPGITDPASLKFRDESELLGKAADPEREYVEKILPEKIRLSAEYADSASLWTDLKLIFGTIARMAR